METIRSYIEEMFKGLPKTKEVVEMRLNIQDHMEEKFQELVKEGIREADASKQVINEFGDMEEIMKELNLQQEDYMKNYISQEAIEQYLKWKKFFSILIGSGVVIIINAMGIYPLILYGLGNNKMSTIIATLIFFILIAIGVVIFILAGIRETDETKILEEGEVDALLKKQMQMKQKENRLLYSILIAIGVILCIMAVGMYMLIEYLLFEEVAIFLFMSMISIAVFLFIFAGIRMNALQMIMQTKSQQQMKLSEKLSASIMLIATIIYLTLGFLFNLWHPGWVVFPIAGIITGIVNIMMGDNK